MHIRSYVLALSACVLAASVTHTRVAATGEFCHGWTDQRNHRREGFYCPEKDDRRRAVICCGRCEYRYCCSDAAARLDQGTCSDSDRDRKLPSKAEVVAGEFSTGDYPVYVPFLIVGSAFLALLLFGGSACFLYNRQLSSSESVAIGTTTNTCSTTTTSAMTTSAMTTSAITTSAMTTSAITTSAMTTAAPCGSSSSLCPHGDRSLGEQPRCRGDSCHVQRTSRDGRPGDAEHPAVEMVTVAALAARHLVAQQQPHPPCILCNVQHSQRAPSPPANQNASQHAFTRPLASPTNQNTSHGYGLSPPLMVMSQQPRPLSPFPALPHHFHTHPQSSSHSKPTSSAQYATMPHTGPAPHDRPPPLTPLGTPVPASLLRSHALSAHPTPAHTHYRIPSPPPSLTLTHTHHPLL